MWRRDQVTAIEEYPDTGLALRTADKRSYMFIPVGLNDYAVVRSQLATWGQIAIKENQSQLLLRCIGVAALVVFGFVALSLLSNALAVAIVGGIMIVGALWLALRVQRAALYQRWFKVMAWCGVALLLVIFAQRLQGLG